MIPSSSLGVSLVNFRAIPLKSLCNEFLLFLARSPDQVELSECALIRYLAFIDKQTLDGMNKSHKMMQKLVILL